MKSDEVKSMEKIEDAIKQLTRAVEKLGTAQKKQPAVTYEEEKRPDPDGTCYFHSFECLGEESNRG